MALHGKETRAAGSLGVFQAPGVERSFFTTQSFEHDKSIGGDARRGVMMEATPVAAFVVRQAEFGFELLVVALDQPTPRGIEDLWH